jgi:Histidine kinase-, DNA gyrase B-, and HSP90-like ATPase
MMTELLKNSCRASIRRYRELQKQAEDNNLDPTYIEIPHIRVVIVKGDEDVTIKVADKGGGIPRSLLPTIWKFAHSTASPNEQKSEFGTDVTGARIRGFGLPLARIYARYFGGELTLKSTEGYGLDAYLHLPRLGDACEKLPLRVRDSPGERDSMPMTMSHNNNNSTSANSSASKSKKTKPAGSVQRTYSTTTATSHKDTYSTTSQTMTIPSSAADTRNALASVRNNTGVVASLGL